PGDDKVGILKLLSGCQPASFGIKNEELLDASYRKATKMNRTALFADFCPHEAGIVDTIARLLMPNAGDKIATKGVKAELYKLNIYAAPSGFFKAHVDTPLSGNQFGFLIASILVHHIGGQFIVCHAGDSVTFEWGTKGKDQKPGSSIHCAAFYSDCEHGILEVTEGHRITLTCNLYYTPGVGDLAGNSPAMEIKTLSLYKQIQAFLKDSHLLSFGMYFLTNATWIR
ncbi:hypothetical protein P154DRAFT_606544, partial [Amniculicola lignicola CBS 123094]